MCQAIGGTHEHEPALFSWPPFTAAELRGRIDQVADALRRSEPTATLAAPTSAAPPRKGRRTRR